jgi:hypothetical protein
MKKYLSCILFSGMLLLTACYGKEEYETWEGSADPGNNGGKWSGDHHHSVKRDSIIKNDTSHF